MKEVSENKNRSPFAALKKFASQRPPAERCELCGNEIADEHPHLIEPMTRQIICSCRPCMILFDNPHDTRYQVIPDRARFLENFNLSDAAWGSLNIPIQLAFFFYSSTEEKIVALYPSPAGATESMLSLESWNEITENNPVLKNIKPDVEALLVNRTGDAHEYYIAPIDECFRLVGLIRGHWRGLSGGTVVWREIKKFYEDLRKNARVEKGEAVNA